MRASRARRPAGRGGFVLALAVVLLLVVSILVPLMVSFTQREAGWTAKQAANTTAFHMAEAGTEKAYLALSLSTITWVNLQLGTALADYNFDRVYSDLSGGTYAISISSGPGDDQATIISVGRDPLKREVRALKVVYSNNPLGGVAIYSNAGAQIGGGVNVEWGAIVSPQNMDAGGRSHPQFRSAGSITTKDTSPTPPNEDSCHWFAYQTNIPPRPLIDLNFYKSSATAQSGCPAGGSPAGSCYYTGNVTWNNETIPGGKTVYIEGTLTVGSPGIDIDGNLVVMGNLNTTSGNFGKGEYDFTVPQQAWKQYCNDWANYRTTYDAAAPAVFPGLNGDYLSSATLTYNPTGNKTAVRGLLYVNGNFTVGGGGGGAEIYGAMYVLGTSTMTSASSVTLYYNEDAAKNMQMTQIALARVSWQDLVTQWPSGLP